MKLTNVSVEGGKVNAIQDSRVRTEGGGERGNTKLRHVRDCYMRGYDATSAQKNECSEQNIDTVVLAQDYWKRAKKE